MKRGRETANELTELTIKLLNYEGHYVWRQNNTTAVRGRTFRGKRGLSDIVGVTKYGRPVFVEVKIPPDRMSVYQEEFKAQVSRRGAIYAVIKELPDCYTLANQLNCK